MEQENDQLFDKLIPSSRRREVLLEEHRKKEEEQRASELLQAAKSRSKASPSPQKSQSQEPSTSPPTVDSTAQKQNPRSPAEFKMLHIIDLSPPQDEEAHHDSEMQNAQAKAPVAASFNTIHDVPAETNLVAHADVPTLAAEEKSSVRLATEPDTAPVQDEQYRFLADSRRPPSEDTEHVRGRLTNSRIELSRPQSCKHQRVSAAVPPPVEIEHKVMVKKYCSPIETRDRNADWNDMSRSIDQLKRFIKDRMAASATRQFIANSDLPIKAPFESEYAKPQKVTSKQYSTAVSTRRRQAVAVQPASSAARTRRVVPRVHVRASVLDAYKHSAKDVADSCFQKRMKPQMIPME